MIRYIRCDGPAGPMLLAEDGVGICRLTFSSCPEENWVAQPSPLLQNAALQLQEYFSGTRTAFDLPLSLTGTDFQKAVWSALAQIPYGETRSYQEIACAIGRPNACRAVGQANNRNPVAVILPCHRVVGQKGTLVGYDGGLAAKELLLRLEVGQKAKSVHRWRNE